MLLTLAATNSNPYQGRGRAATSDGIRKRALARLYERRATVDNLIEMLQRYQEQRRGLAPCIEISAGRKCS
jgi:hypothetical protein